MVMDTLAGLAFSYETPRIEYMKEKPKRKDESIINKYMIGEIIISGIYSLCISLLFLKLPIIRNKFADYGHFMTAFFTLFILLAVFNSFNARTHRLNIFAHLKENKLFIFIILFIILVQLFIIYSGISIFNTTPISIVEFLFVTILAITIIPIDLIRKFVIKKINGQFTFSFNKLKF